MDSPWGREGGRIRIRKRKSKRNKGRDKLTSSSFFSIERKHEPISLDEFPCSFLFFPHLTDHLSLSLYFCFSFLALILCVFLCVPFLISPWTSFSLFTHNAEHTHTHTHTHIKRQNSTQLRVRVDHKDIRLFWLESKDRTSSRTVLGYHWTNHWTRLLHLLLQQLPLSLSLSLLYKWCNTRVA